MLRDRSGLPLVSDYSSNFIFREKQEKSAQLKENFILLAIVQAIQLFLSLKEGKKVLFSIFLSVFVVVAAAVSALFHTIDHLMLQICCFFV